jgi:hypothetical protein
MRQNKVVIYTAIAGGVDDLIQHSYRSEDFNYVCFSDRPIDNPGIWEVRLMKKSQLDDVRKAKYYKLFPHELFSEYQHSVWVDGSIDIRDDSLEKKVFALIRDSALIAANVHPHRTCSYEEANACISMGKDDAETILRQVDFMKSNGFSQDLGLYELMIIYRRHQDRKVIKLMADWWWMIKTFSRRDQISFMYALNKNHMVCTKLFEQDIRTNPAFSLKKHSTFFYAKMMVDTGNGYNYKNMVIKRFAAKKNSIIEMGFDLGNIHKIKRIRFTPFNTGVGKIKLTGITLESSNDQLINIESKNLKSNGFQEGDYVVFHTFNPIFEAQVDSWAWKIIVSGIFDIENETESRQIISNMLKMMQASVFWKMRKAILWLSRELCALFTPLIL